MNRAVKIFFLVLFATYLVLQLFAFALQGRKKLGVLERGVLFVTAPVQQVVADRIDSIGQLFNHYLFLIGVSRQNEALTKEVGLLYGQLSALKEIENENMRLRDLLRMGQEHRLELIGARRVAVGASPYQRVIRIQRGLGDHVQQGYPVVNHRGVVGQVVDSYAEYADVLLLVDKISAVDAINQRTRQRAILRGHSLQSLRFEYLSTEADIKEGDEMVTSGLDGVYPKGIPIGFVSQLGDRYDQFFLQALVTPYVNFRDLEDVGVVARHLHQEP